MKRTYVMVDGEFVERKRGKNGRYHYVIPDIQPYKSMIDGRMVTSRSEHRRHLKANNCIEIGNENPMKPAARPPENNTRVEVLRHQLANLTHSQANKLLSRLRDDIRFTHDPHRRK
jgi:hypothetical protein